MEGTSLSCIGRTVVRNAALLLIALSFAGVQPGVAIAEDDWGAMSARLAPEMTEQQVMAALGYRPNKVELETCGGDTAKGAWPCKIYTFGGPMSNLRVYFHDNGINNWSVNGWRVFP
jgi:hypothetical protein